MDIFVRHIPSHATQKQLDQWFSGPLNFCGVNDYHVEKLGEKPNAIITVLDTLAGQRFLQHYGVPSNARPHVRALMNLSWDGKNVQCMRAKNDPTDICLQSVLFEKSQRAKRIVDEAHKAQSTKTTTRFNVGGLQCGVFDYTKDKGKDSQLTFTSHFTDYRHHGHVSFGLKAAIIMMGEAGGDQCRVDINYHDCSDIVLGTYQDASITFNMQVAPKFYEVKGTDMLSAAMAALHMGVGNTKRQETKKTRLHAIDHAHAQVAASCFVYRIYLADKKLIENIKSLLKRNRRMCPIIMQKTTSQYPQQSLKEAFVKLNHELADTKRFGRRPFGLRYQVDKLARNGILAPGKVLRLLPKIALLHDAYGLDATSHALGRLNRERVLPGPLQQADDFSLGKLEELLESYAVSYDTLAPDNPYELSKRHTHINLVHKIIVTPAGTYLEGPDAEPTNRVLRRYQHSTDHFVRVIFQDEDRSPMRHDPRTDQSRIYHMRFKGVLDGSVLICGRAFSFLGFSHSSLRSQSCWFSAPMVNKQGSLIFAEQVIKELGDFSKIRVPAKCAARIGQNFTDTNASVKLRPEEVFELPNVERNGRDFSDGVGTISEKLLQSVHRRYGSKRLLKPTALQIRFQGSKGMVALDSRLPGKKLMIRPNMKKYETAATWDLEICGAAFRPLPMVLNRPFIKVMEDLGTPTSTFMDLQNAAMTHLQRMTASCINTAIFLDDSEACRATRMSELIRYLGHIGLDYHHDHFLYSVVEMAVVAKLRDIKYKGRIPVEQGVTLYGIMDETGYLGPREIYVVTEKAEGGKTVVVANDVIVTRSPALHPGDMQLVNAVNVPETSPLKRLSNVVVFSKHGDRDLPSQLGGGDLDGDLYNVIWDPNLRPRRTFQAADYPRVSAVQLDRDVVRKDMSDFFVAFMESDVLGMICTTHLQLADQRSAGVLDPDCIKLAGMASTAVDFSKTGIPVSIKEIPRYTRVKPDFMAPSPRVVVSENGFLDFEEDDDEEDDAFEGLDTERRRTRFYRSDKALGHLYRAIDEGKFLHNMQNQHRQINSRPLKDDLMSVLLAYVKKWAAQYGVLYDHHLTLAANIRAR